MKLSTTTAMYRDRPQGRAVIPIMDCVKRLHRAGYEDVDFNFCLMNQYDLELTNDHWMDWVKEMKEVLEELHMTAGQAHAPFYNVLDPSSVRDVNHTEEMVRRSVMAAGQLGVKAIVIHGGTYFFDNDYKKILRDNVEYFKPHVELAAKYGMSVAVENLFDKMDHKLGYRCRRFTARVDEVLDLVEALSRDYDNVGVCWDFGHANEMGWDQPQALEMIGKRLIATHVQDNYGVIDDHLLPYHGTIDWEPVMTTLKKIGYEGAFAYETHKAAMRVPEPLMDALLAYSVELGKYLISLYDKA
ncbi:MAG: sugar phosphate isomerase/epimerase [Hungatella sp.]|nr:sugar phosphate isomerase/epimerase [Hungatella sp.]